MQQAFIGVDVGTASARAGIFGKASRLLATARHPMGAWHEAGDVVGQSSADIWDACMRSIREAMKTAGLPPEIIVGLGFDATCSLMVLDPQGCPLTVSPSGDPTPNVVVWMDHRATRRRGASTRRKRTCCAMSAASSRRRWRRRSCSG